MTDDFKKKVEEDIERMMNPLPADKFDPATFDPMEGFPENEVAKRNRELPPDMLPDMGMYPKTPRVGQMIGMYESKQDLYLLIAWLSKRVTALEKDYKKLEGEIALIKKQKPE